MDVFADKHVDESGFDVLNRVIGYPGAAFPDPGTDNRRLAVLVRSVLIPKVIRRLPAYSFLIFDRRAQIVTIEFLLDDRFYRLNAPGGMSLHGIPVNSIGRRSSANKDR